MAAGTLRELIFNTTDECAQLENSKPPYRLGMIMAKKPFFLINSQVSGLRSPFLKTSHSSTIWQSFSVGPSRNSCSSRESAGGLNFKSLSNDGSPANKSPSKLTVPAFNASLSVLEMGTCVFFKILNTILDTKHLRKYVT